MKKIAIILSIIMVIFCVRYYICNSCYSIYLTQTNFGEHKAEQLIKYLSNNDIENLKDMFCLKVSTTHDLEKELKEASNFFDGKISSEYSILISGSESVRSGVVVSSGISGHIDNIITDNNTIYEINFYYNANSEDDKSIIGMTKVNIYDTTNNQKLSIGE